jgi:hypothetical protein
MRNTLSIYRRIIWGSVICLLAFSGIFASNTNDAAKVNFNSKATSEIVIQNLTKKLKADLVQEKILVKLGNIEQTAVSNNEIKLQGNATCVLPTEKTQLPIRFEAKFDRAGKVIDDVQYTFVESEYAPANEEEVLMKEIMKQISRDYKTREIVIAIDNFESSDSLENKVQYKGAGEVKIGEIQWSRINFNVVLNSDKTAAKIEYKIQK